MDSLCSLSGQRECSSNEKQTKKQKVATMAWAAFQVLANRCIEWEKVEGMLNLNDYQAPYICVDPEKILIHWSVQEEHSSEMLAVYCNNG